ncbi:MAG: hypothetical protein CME88_05800 [Hirschia sp.]|nr:hypothetical protein [Hirschia sp.]MBF17878.1 hypothetical protein [Hirschia sp.]|tara:strand:+ start:821 stop:1627 length:807 start_codon:yes stop_codon:yes gene_type:complete
MSRFPRSAALGALALMACASGACTHTASAQSIYDDNLPAPESMAYPSYVTDADGSYVVNGVHYSQTSDDSWTRQWWKENIATRFIAGATLEDTCIHYTVSQIRDGVTQFPETGVMKLSDWAERDGDLGLYHDTQCAPIEQMLLGEWGIITPEGRTIIDYKTDGTFVGTFYSSTTGDIVTMSGDYRVAHESSGNFHLEVRIAREANWVTLSRNVFHLEDNGRLFNVTANNYAYRVGEPRLLTEEDIEAATMPDYLGWNEPVSDDIWAPM